MYLKRVFALVFCVLYGTIARAQIDTLQYELKGSVLVSTGNKSGLKGRLSEGMTLERSLIDRMPQFLGSGDPIGLMRMLPGVQTVTEYESGIHICGGENSHNDVSVAGVPVFGVSHLFGFFSAFNPLHYQQISFSTSPDLRSNRIGGSIIMEIPDNIGDKTVMEIPDSASKAAVRAFAAHSFSAIQSACAATNCSMSARRMPRGARTISRASRLTTSASVRRAENFSS